MSRQFQGLSDRHLDVLIKALAECVPTWVAGSDRERHRQGITTDVLLDAVELCDLLLKEQRARKVGAN